MWLSLRFKLQFFFHARAVRSFRPLPKWDNRYCIPKSQNPELKIQNPKSKIFYELPISNLTFAHQVFPWGGGCYFRMIPFPLFRWGVKSILKKEKAYLLYMHPWKIDPQQPRVNEVSTFFRFRHYINLKKTHSKLSKLITEFCHCRFTSCKQYLSQIF